MAESIREYAWVRRKQKARKFRKKWLFTEVGTIQDDRKARDGGRHEWTPPHPRCLRATLDKRNGNEDC
jgi:hypothetical protein